MWWMMSKTVTIIVPVKDDQQGINNLFDLIEKQSYPLKFLDVIVVDNNSEPPLKLEREYFFRSTLLTESKPSGFAARNRAVTAATGDILAFTDADCSPSAEWIAEAVSVLTSETEVMAVAGSVHIFTTDTPRFVELYEMVFAFPQAHYVENLHFGVTANLTVRKEVFEIVGFFNEELQSGGDNEWGNRLYRAGEKMVFADSVVMNHPARKSWSELSRKIKRTIAGYCTIRCKDGITLKIFYRELIADLFPIRQLFFIIKQNKVRGFVNKTALFFIVCRLKICRVWMKALFFIQQGRRR